MEPFLHKNDCPEFRRENSLLIEILNTLPYTAIILNKDREILFANEISLNSDKHISVNNIIGKKPGEAFNCAHYLKGGNKCGANSLCRFCGMTDVIMKSQKSGKKETQESRINRLINGIQQSFEFEVTACPFNWNGKEFVILTMLDISEQKRKKALERIFFHDILNKTGSLSGFFQLIRHTSDPTDKDELLEIAESVSWDLNEEIIGQKQLNAAEDGELILNENIVLSKEIIERIVKQLSKFELFKNYSINISNKCTNELIVDESLLKRILMNMLKNALEASSKDDLITFGCKNNDPYVRFYVHNQTYIEEHTQLQIFQRSFSTKGNDRGLGTYSMKLLGEGYLNGKVGFTSTKNEGTTFYIDLPRNAS